MNAHIYSYKIHQGESRFCLKWVLKQIICKPFPLAVLKVIIFRSVCDCSETTVIIDLIIWHAKSAGVLEMTIKCKYSEFHFVP